MNIRTINKIIFLFALSTPVLANHMNINGPMVNNGLSGQAYLGVFGGGGASTNVDVNQFATAYFTEAAGGPLAVDAFGHTNSQSTWLAGAQVGYQAPEILLTEPAQWGLSPAVELEGYYLGKQTYNATVVNNTVRLPQHDFDVSYPMETGVFLGNAVLSFNNPSYPIQPYIGVGIGGVLAKISGAVSTQIAPPELDVNHYNAKTNDMTSAFATQVKVGLSYDITKCIALFAEYRWLYIAPMHYTFGSTVYPGHAATSPWLVKLDSQNYNLGSAGIRFFW